MDAYWYGLYSDCIAGRLQLGTHPAYRVLTRGDSGVKGGSQGDGIFLRTIYGLEERHNAWPILPYLNYQVNAWPGLELVYDSMAAETVALPPGYSESRTDGTLCLTEPTLSL